MIYYVYDPKTWEYVGTIDHKVPNCTEVKPPDKKEHQAILYQSDEWYVVEDWRGTHVYSYDGLLDMEITCFGPLPLEEGYTLIPPPPERDGELRNFDVESQTWICSLMEGWIYDNMVPRPMTTVERIQHGLDPMPPDMKIIDGDLVPKTPYELYADGLITIQEANDIIKRTREYEYEVNTDKYGLMYIRGEVTLEFWQEEIQKVKDMYPYIIGDNNG